jgi:NAD(P)-dependent dehydrogenase (short-subunit alcohol dehydrogenase family)
MSGALAGRVALVTGGGRGIGRAIAETLHAQGAAVMIADSGTSIGGDGADPTLACDLAKSLGKNAAAFIESIASPSAAASVVARTIESFGGIDIIVNNAAILRDAFVFKSDPADWEAVIRTNLSAPFYVIAAATAAMRDQAKAGRGSQRYEWGRIVNLVSTAGFYGNYGQASYAAAKAGLLGLTRVVALDMARTGVTCNAVAPFAGTRVTESIKPQNPAQATYKEHALKIPAAPIADLVAWLAGPEAQEVSGQLFGVRGRELYLFSQPRPMQKLTLGGGAGELSGAMARLKPDFLPVTTDLEAFGGEAAL